jgi:hypothetical protein
MRSQTVAMTPAAAGEPGDLELRRNRFGSQEVTVEAVSVAGGGSRAEEIRSGESLTVTARIESRSAEAIEAHVAVALRRASDGLVCADASSERGGLRLRLAPQGSAVVSAAFPRVDLAPGDYAVDVGVYEAGWSFAYDFHWSAYPLRVAGAAGGEGVMEVPVRWESEPG